MERSRYLIAGHPERLQAVVLEDLSATLGRRGAEVNPEGAGGRGVVVEAADFCILLDVAHSAGRPSARALEYDTERRSKVEADRGKPTHLLVSRDHTTAALVHQVAADNIRLERGGCVGRALFLDLEGLAFLLDRLNDAPANMYPNERWRSWFADWRSVGSDGTALERLCGAVMRECVELHVELGEMLTRRRQAEHEQLRDDIRRLDDALRQRGTTGRGALHCLVASVFIKWYEEMRELRGAPNRFTAEGFTTYQSSLADRGAAGHDGCTLRALLATEFGEGASPEQRALREGVAPAEALTNSLLHEGVFPVLDKHRFRGTGRNPLDAVLDATLHRGGTDARIGQYFTPAPVARFAVAVVRPAPAEVVLDPAAGAGAVLRYIAEHMRASASTPDISRADGAGCITGAGRLLGCDTDCWIASVARMNLYMHGGRADDVRVENALLLADTPVFGAPLQDAVDVCIVHPPLGTLDYRHVAAELLQRHPGIHVDEDEWVRTRLPVIRGIGAAPPGAGRVRGSTTKAGALFLSAISGCLKSRGDSTAPAEWRGGRLGIILDEAILNTAEHARTREIVRCHYYVKAVFSFGRDAFWYEARTTAKMSLLYLVKKGDEGEDQREPTFFAHAESVGIDRRGRSNPSDLPRVLDAYLRFEAAVRAGYAGCVFDEPTVRGAVATLKLPAGVHVRWPDEAPPRDDARMDYAHAVEIRGQPRFTHGSLELGDIVNSVVRLPAEDPSDCYTFGTVDRATGEVRLFREAVTRYALADLRVIRTGDVVVSGIDLVNGAAGYAYPEADGLVLSREFYTLTPLAECSGDVDSRFLALLLRTPEMRRAALTLVTGTSGRTRIKNADSLLTLPIPPFPPLVAQHEIVAHVERARAAMREADAATARVHAAINACWKPAFRPR